MDFSEQTAFESMLSDVSVPPGTTLRMEIHAGNSETPDASWTPWRFIENTGGLIPDLSGNRYIQWRTIFTTTDQYKTPEIKMVSIASAHWTYDHGVIAVARGGSIASSQGFYSGTYDHASYAFNGGDAVRLSGENLYPRTQPVGVVSDPETGTIWVTDYRIPDSPPGGEQVTHISHLDSSGSIIGGSDIGIPGGVGRMIYATSSHAIWGTAPSGVQLVKISPVDGTVLGTYPTGANPLALTLCPSNDSIWVTNTNDNTVSQFDQTGARIAGPFTVGVLPMSVACDPVNNIIWTANSGNRSVTRLNPITGTTTEIILSTRPNGVTFDPHTNSMWVIDGDDSTLTKLDLAGNILGTFPVGGNPNDIVFDGFTNSVWTVNSGGSSVSRVNTETGARMDFPVSMSPYALAIDMATHSAWVTNSGNNSVSKLQLAGGAYAASGSLTSQVIDLGAPAVPSTITFNAILGGQTITMDLRAGDTGVVDNSWTPWVQGLTSGGDVSSLGHHRYFQYRAHLSTTDGATSPDLRSVVINYGQYRTSGALISSIYDTGASGNSVVHVSWTATGTSQTETVKVQVRSSPDGQTWSDWCGPNICDGADYFTQADNGVSLPVSHPLADGVGDRYLQYRILLESAGAASPIVQSIAIGYDIGASASPIVSGVHVTDITANSATISWNTDLSADAYVWYGKEEALTVHGTSGAHTLSLQHSVQLTGLAPSTRYYLKIRSSDALGQLGVDNTFGLTRFFVTAVPQVTIGGYGAGGGATVQPTTPKPIAQVVPEARKGDATKSVGESVVQKKTTAHTSTKVKSVKKEIKKNVPVVERIPEAPTVTPKVTSLVTPTLSPTTVTPVPAPVTLKQKNIVERVLIAPSITAKSKVKNITCRAQNGARSFLGFFKIRVGAYTICK